MNIYSYALPMALLAFGTSAHAQSIKGDWLTDDRSAVIRVAACGQHMCGTIERILDPAAPAHDINNHDRAKRSRPLVGTPVLLDFKRTMEGWGGGMAYDPKAGRSYHSHLAMDGAKGLNVTGCVLFICRTRRWVRAE